MATVIERRLRITSQEKRDNVGEKKCEVGYNRLGHYDYFIVLSPFLGFVEPVESEHGTTIDTLFYNDFRCQSIKSFNF